MGFGDDEESFMVSFVFGFFCCFFGYFGFCFQRYTRPFNTSRLGAHLALVDEVKILRWQFRSRHLPATREDGG